MADRKPLSKKIRFEVFKRDKFTCQYCGRMAPDVVLQVDHIKPVSKGGKNDILNLVTSCADCNNGKSNIELSDDSAIKKQQAQLKNIADRKEQLDMLIKWRDELDVLNTIEVNYIAETFEKNTKYSLKDQHKRSIKKWLSEFSMNEVLDALNISVNTYYIGSWTSASEAFNKIPGICFNQRKQRGDNQLYYMNYTLKALRQKNYEIREDILKIILSENVKTDEDFEIIKKCLKSSSCWEDFVNKSIRAFNQE